MNCWELLEIPPTGEARTLKKAYTRLLRKYPPEADPEGFKRLRTAYEEARFLIEYGLVEVAVDGTGAATPESAPVPDGAGGSGVSDSKAGDSGAATVAPGEATPPVSFPLPAELVFDRPVATPPSAEVEAVMARVRKDFPNHALRQSEAYWKELAESEILWNLSAKAELGASLFRFLGDAYLERGSRYTDIHVPKESWKALDQAFGWLENEGEWYARFPEELANAVLDRVRAARNLALSTDLKGGYEPVRDLLIDGADPASRFRWVGWLLWVAVVMVLNGVFFRCS